jgi:hypothetical protein
MVLKMYLDSDSKQRGNMASIVDYPENNSKTPHHRNIKTTMVGDG